MEEPGFVLPVSRVTSRGILNCLIPYKMVRQGFFDPSERFDSGVKWVEAVEAIKNEYDG